jgi:hypothetical protein
MDGTARLRGPGERVAPGSAGGEIRARPDNLSTDMAGRDDHISTRACEDPIGALSRDTAGSVD